MILLNTCEISLCKRHRTIGPDQCRVPQFRCVIHLHQTGMSNVSVSGINFNYFDTSHSNVCFKH